ncbi:ammonium transporter [Loigolactobacillus zhaoyuanensis]|uniref:Ammonium transporter n=1 Tax=Loigolactobacillus zhaoyuanensis TaxID=2486017 RepID=A0ABW8U9L5_9LACO|nr:ammonium transporter [Loigolactobacillus zhaoyuanensis]
MNTANTAFILIASILVLFMTPGLAFFYGGLVSRRNVVNTMLSVFFICGIAILMWVAVGYELSFHSDIGGFIGTVQHFFLAQVKLDKTLANGLPTGVYLLFQMMFAIITPALFVGAVVGRIRFKFLLWFIILWSILVYYPMVHMVWSANGLLANLGIIDFAGGTVVHINAGITAFVLSAFLGRRHNYGQAIQHYNLPWVLLGTTILWIGWYGFNAGSALAINSVALQAALTTTVATATGMIAWMTVDIFMLGRPTLVGVCTGTLCGLVGITPAAGYVTLTGAFWIGILAVAASYTFITVLKPRIGVDDALDAFGCHGVSGIMGSIVTGLFATKSVNAKIPENGLFYGGGFKLLGMQLLGTVLTIIFVAVMCVVLISLLRLVVPMRVAAAEEDLGLDQGEHGESVDYLVKNDRDFRNYRAEFKGQMARLQHHHK